MKKGGGRRRVFLGGKAFSFFCSGQKRKKAIPNAGGKGGETLKEEKGRDVSSGGRVHYSRGGKVQKRGEERFGITPRPPRGRKNVTRGYKKRKSEKEITWLVN